MSYLKKTIKLCFAFCLNIYLDVMSLLIILVNSKIDLPIKRLRVNLADECVVLGNGPSLKETLENSFLFLRNKKVICVNEFCHSNSFKAVRPNYYVFADSAYWLPSASKRNKEQCKITYKVLKEVDWPMVIFLPIDAKGRSNLEDVSTTNKNISFEYFNMVPIKCPDSFKFTLYKKYLASPLIQNVLVGAIYLMLNIGFKKIYIIGADHSWTESISVGEDNRLYWKNPHFFDKKETELEPILMPPDEKRNVKINELFFAFADTFSGYIELEAYAEYMGTKIYNASEKSYIDAFKRIKIPKDKI